MAKRIPTKKEFFDRVRREVAKKPVWQQSLRIIRAHTDAPHNFRAGAGKIPGLRNLEGVTSVAGPATVLRALHRRKLIDEVHHVLAPNRLVITEEGRRVLAQVEAAQ